eukprot:GEMP01036645.1.p1 GENE.GEMP01036645.1~~GEMP01036645.1.p1  ORF type:complete len:494 (+),score=72.55 GEMP01036645.1:108-1589(+)
MNVAALSSAAGPAHIHIPLCQRDTIPESSSDAVFYQISDEFSKRYLQALNVTPTVQNRQVVKKHLPLASLLGTGVSASWNRGTIADAMTIRLHPQESEVSGVTRDKFTKKFLNCELPKMANLKDNSEQQRTEEHVTKFEKYDMPQTQETIRITADVEQLRQKRIHSAITDQATQQEKSKRKHFAEQLAILKRKFIFPFCAEILDDVDPSTASQENQGVKSIDKNAVRVHNILSDRRPLTLKVPEHLVPAIRAPFHVTLADLWTVISEFVENDLPFDFLAGRRDRNISRLRKLLVSKGTIEIAALSAHFFYWRCFGHLHTSTVLPQESIEAVYCSITDRWSVLEEHLKQGPNGLFHLATVVLTLKWAIDWSFRKQFPQVMDAVGSDFIYRLNLFFLRVFDRDLAVYSHFGALDSSVHAMKLEHALKVKCNSYKASNLVQMVMSNGLCGDSATRALLAKSSASNVPNEPLQEHSRSALYQIAFRRCNRTAKSHKT